MAPTGEAFRRWFGQSKVTNDSGEPLIVYHGSPDARGLFVGGEHGRDGRWAPAPGIAPGFRPSPSRGSAFFAVDRADVAQSYAKDGRAWDYQGADPAVVPLYLSIQNPLVVDGKGQSWRGTEQTVEAARRGGHDGVIILRSIDYYSNDKNARPATVYVFFEPGQAKSALDGPLRSLFDGQPIPGAGPNVGTFDRADSDLTRNMERNPPLDRLKFIVKTYGEKQPWVVLDTISVMAPTIGIDDLRGECESLMHELVDSGEWSASAAARHNRHGDPIYLGGVFAASDGKLLPALYFLMNHLAVKRDGKPFTADEALTTWNDVGAQRSVYAMLLDLVQHPYFDERMREAHQADGIFPWVATQLSKLSKAVFQNPPIYGDYLDALKLLRKRGNAIAQWAKLNRIDLGTKTLAEVLEATAQFRVSGTNIRQGRVDFEYDDGWTMQELRSKRELKDEGHVMQHCVGGYCEDVESGKSQIFSLRDPDGSPHATIEWKPPEDTKSLSRARRVGHFEQIFGAQNEDVTDPDIVARIVAWIRARFPDDATGELLLGVKVYQQRTLDLRGTRAMRDRRDFEGYSFKNCTIILDGYTSFLSCVMDDAHVHAVAQVGLVFDACSGRKLLISVSHKVLLNLSSSILPRLSVIAEEGVENASLRELIADRSDLSELRISPIVHVEFVSSEGSTWTGAALRDISWYTKRIHGRSVPQQTMASEATIGEIVGSGAAIDRKKLPPSMREDMSERDFFNALDEMQDAEDVDY